MSRASLTGNIYGDIKAIEYIGNKRYRCQCIKCGAVSEQYSTNLRGQMSCKVCGEGYRVDLTGQVYGDLKVVAYNKETKKWICKCDKCGCTTEVKSNNLKDGNTTTCGKCGYIEHAQSDIVGGTRISQLNKRRSKNNTSGETGVSYNRRKDKWCASIRFCGVRHWLGYYDKKEDAIAAHRTAEEKLKEDFYAEYGAHKK